MFFVLVLEHTKGGATLLFLFTNTHKMSDTIRISESANVAEALVRIMTINTAVAATA